MAPASLPLSTRSLSEFYRHALPLIYGFLVTRCSDPGIAEELCADAFLAAATQVRAGRADIVSLPWLFGVARHKLSDFYRRRDLLRRLLTTLPPEPLMPDIAIASTRDDDLLEALRALPDAQRAAVLLRYQDDMTVEDVAGVLDVSVRAAESLLARARISLRARLEQGQTDD
jgi:RNA polymerase sigma-70 factor (ECF subfamily)